VPGEFLQVADSGVDPAAAPAPADGDRPLAADDFMTGATEDRYPDHFDLARGINGGGNDFVASKAATTGKVGSWYASASRNRCWAKPTL